MEREVDVLLIGGGVASVRCARMLRRSGFDGSILLVGDEPTLPYNRPPLSKELLRDDVGDGLLAAEPASWYARRRVDARVGVTVTELDVADQVAHLADERAIRFGRCLLATGAEPRVLRVPGGERALVLRTVGDARRIATAADAAGEDGRVTVIGGGFLGVELASSFVSLGLRPTIVEMADRLWGGTLGTELDGWARNRLADAGVQLHLGATVTGLELGAARIGDARLDHAFAVAGIGVVPSAVLAEAAGLETDDGIITDANHRTAHTAVWAAGDVARVAGRRVEHWHTAREAGERAALSMLGEPVPARRASWFFSEVAAAALDVFGDPDGWSDERWIGKSVVAFLDGDRVVRLAVIGAAIEPSIARNLVEEGASPSAVERALRAA